MKKILFIALLVVASLTVNAQVNFMGIPVDGTATEMIQKLKNKGFYKIGNEYTYEQEGKQLPILKGTFNGCESYIWVLTNRGKVYRICVTDVKNVSESQIITNFNNLFYQFANNPKYLWIGGNEIDRKENVSYEMSCHNKVYEAGFYQILSDSMKEKNSVWFKISKSLDRYYISIYYDNEINEANGEDLQSCVN